MFYNNTVEHLVRSKMDSICYLMKIIYCFMYCILCIAQINSFFISFRLIPESVTPVKLVVSILLFLASYHWSTFVQFIYFKLCLLVW